MDILLAAARMVRPGGRLVYATCTFNPAENEENVYRLMQADRSFHLQPWQLNGLEASTGMFTLYPHLHRGEGQFAALLCREGDQPPALEQGSSLPRPDAAAIHSLRDFAPNAPAANCVLGETLCALPLQPELRGLRVLRAGLHLGSMHGKLFLPDHAWAMSSTPPALPRVTLSEEEAFAYQRGEELPCSSGLRG